MHHLRERENSLIGQYLQYRHLSIKTPSSVYQVYKRVLKIIFLINGINNYVLLLCCAQPAYIPKLYNVATHRKASSNVVRTIN